MLCIITQLPFLPSDGESLRIDKVIVPKMVTAGETVELTCQFDLEGAKLYSLTWWKDNGQFYVVNTDDGDSPKVYSSRGLDVDVSTGITTSQEQPSILLENSNKQ